MFSKISIGHLDRSVHYPFDLPLLSRSPSFSHGSTNLYSVDFWMYLGLLNKILKEKLKLNKTGSIRLYRDSMRIYLIPWIHICDLSSGGKCETFPLNDLFCGCSKSSLKFLVRRQMHVTRTCIHHKQTTRLMETKPVIHLNNYNNRVSTLNCAFIS